MLVYLYSLKMFLVNGVSLSCYALHILPLFVSLCSLKRNVYH